MRETPQGQRWKPSPPRSSLIRGQPSDLMNKFLHNTFTARQAATASDGVANPLKPCSCANTVLLLLEQFDLSLLFDNRFADARHAAVTAFDNMLIRRGVVGYRVLPVVTGHAKRGGREPG